MLRFRDTLAEGDAVVRRRSGVSSRQRLRLWMLLLALGLVVATMRQLDKPQTAERLGQLFGAAPTVTEEPTEHQFVISTTDSSEQSSVAEASSKQPLRLEAIHEEADVGDALASVRDNTYFRPSESDAWFALFERLQKMDDQQLSDANLGELTYTQLLKQPHVYRGKIVTIKGMLRREEVEQPAENSLGIDIYHRLVIQPQGGGHWPFVAYCLELPGGLPRGDELQESVSVTGFFFKNWSYAWQDGLGIAPVILARGVDWQPAVAQPTRRTLRSTDWTKAVFVAVGFATVVVYLVFRNTRRPARRQQSVQVSFPDASTVETLDQRLRRFSDAGQSE